MRRLMICMLFFLATTMVMAEKRTAAQKVDTGDSALDSLLVLMNQKMNQYHEDGIGKLEMYALIHGTSWNTRQGRLTRWFPDLIPFDIRSGKSTTVDTYCQIGYQYPCEMLVTPLSILCSNRRRGRRITREASETLLPTLTMRHMNEKGDDKQYILPFSDDGLQRYRYEMEDTVIEEGKKYLQVRFAPNQKHHTLLEGTVLIEEQEMRLAEMRLNGKIDFGHISDTITFGEVFGKWVPINNRSLLHYKYGKSEGYNRFSSIYFIDDIKSKSDMDERTQSLDLTKIYTPQRTIFYNTDTTKIVIPRKKNLFQQLPQRLVGSNTIDAFGTDLRIYGPLNPASIGYDKFNGFTLHEQLRISRIWDNGQSLVIRPEVGYSFGLKEFRYKFDSQWIYAPKIRAGIRLLAQNRSSGFSSKFKDNVNDAIKDYKDKLEDDTKKTWKEGLNFDDLGLHYYKRYEFQLEHSLELCNGLMGYIGTSYNYRTPVRHGSRAMSQADIDKLVDKFYADMNPFLRLSWTPRQYYHIQNNQKRYLSSLWPTFSLEVAQGIYGFCGSTSNYSRFELDAQHRIRLDDVRHLSWHIGGGSFFRQKGEYFINYSYFSRSMYPSTWDKDTHGGVFSLLDDYWYSSSPGYIQAHIMYESPFMLLHTFAPISKYVIKERIYLSNLWADGKNAYTEMGYGMGNNYFNVGVFCSFVGLQFMDIGAKFSIEIDQHL